MTLRRLIPPFLAVMVAAVPVKAADQPRAVIEMFTSQGCNSCPPADKLVGEYTKDPGIIVLSYSVTYWDYLGWRDTLASPDNTLRQQAYAASRGDRQVYTPQAIVDGMYHAVGSDRRDIEAKAQRARGVSSALPPLSVPVVVASAAGKTNVSIGSEGSKAPLSDCRVSLVEFDKERTVSIERGENRGATITYHNVVRSAREIGRWTGGELKLSLDAKAGDPNKGAVILVQEMSRGVVPGIIVGAAELR